MRLAILILGLSLSGAIPHSVSAQPRRGERAARLVQTGRALVHAGNPVSAISYFRQAIQVDTHHPDGYLELAEVYLSQQRVPLALEVVQAGIRRARSADLHLLLARIHRERGDLEEAASVLGALVGREPRSVAAHAQRAEVARERGRWSEALSSYRAILALAEEGETVSDETRAEAGRYSQAIALLVGDLDPVSRCGEGPLRAALCAR